MSVPVAMSRLKCGIATGMRSACGTMDITSLTPSMFAQAIKSIFTFVLKVHLTCGTA
jgi:hypothetical protein